MANSTRPVVLALQLKCTIQPSIVGQPKRRNPRPATNPQVALSTGAFTSLAEVPPVTRLVSSHRLRLTPLYYKGRSDQPAQRAQLGQRVTSAQLVRLAQQGQLG